MKKLLSIMLCLMLLLSGLALAESAALPELYTIDFGYFTMGLTANDTYRVAAERQDNTAYAIIYPNYDAANPSPSNINVVWSSDDFSLHVKLFGASLYTQSMLQSTANLYQQMGFTLTNQQIHEATFDEGIYSATFSYDVSSEDQSMTLFQKQNYYFLGDAGVYAFTITAHSLEELASLDFYYDHIVIK